MAHKYTHIGRDCARAGLVEQLAFLGASAGAAKCRVWETDFKIHTLRRHCHQAKSRCTLSGERWENPRAGGSDNPNKRQGSDLLLCLSSSTPFFVLLFKEKKCRLSPSVTYAAEARARRRLSELAAKSGGQEDNDCRPPTMICEPIFALFARTGRVSGRLVVHRRRGICKTDPPAFDAHTPNTSCPFLACHPLRAMSTRRDGLDSLYHCRLLHHAAGAEDASLLGSCRRLRRLDSGVGGV